MLTDLSIAWLVAVLWLMLRAWRQSFALPRLEPAAPDTAAGLPSARIAVVIPARDEAANIGPCVQSLLAQDYPAGRLDVLVVDDHSADATAAIVRGLAEADARVRLFSSPALPPRWTGKSHACWFGTRQVDESADWLCFMDADTIAKPSLIATALRECAARQLDFLSLTPRQVLVSFAERLVMPCGLYFLSFRQDLMRVQAVDGDDAVATGQFILVRRDAYGDVGGHAAVRADISEDVALARLIKRAGYRVTIAGGDALYRTRMYTGWRTLWIGVSKNLVDMMGGPLSTALTAVAGTVLSWTAVVLPVADVVGFGHADHPWLALGAASLASLAAAAFHIGGAVFFRIPVWYGLTFPVGYTIGAAMALDSVRRRATGRTRWKGRVYA